MKALRRISYSRRPSSTSVTISPSASAHPWEEDRHKVLSVGASFSVKVRAHIFYPHVLYPHVLDINTFLSKVAGKYYIHRIN